RRGAARRAGKPQRVQGWRALQAAARPAGLASTAISEGVREGLLSPRTGAIGRSQGRQPLGTDSKMVTGKDRCRGEESASVLFSRESEEESWCVRYPIG